MSYAEFYENRITRELDKKEVSLWKDFYNNILPERVKQFKKAYKGKPQKLQKAIEKLEQDAAASYREEIDEQLTTLCDGLRTQAYFDAVKRLDQMQENMPDKVDNPVLDSGNRSLASEIIADQQEEIEKLKVKLQKAESDRDDFFAQKSVLIMQQDIINFTMHITDSTLLKQVYGTAKAAYKKQEQEDECDGKM